MKFKRIYIELTNVCGLHCSFCPSLQAVPQSMDLDFFDSVIAQCSHYTKEIACHVMGDPLTLPNLDSYLDILHRYGMKALLTTSGYYLKKHSIHTLLHPAVKQINISLNSYNKNDSAITLEQYLTPILNLCQEKLKQERDIFINLRLWNLDENISERSFNEQVFEQLSRAFEIEIDSNEIYTHRPKSLRLERKILLHFDDYFEWPSLQNPLYGDGRCHGLSSHIAILSNGNVAPCCLDGECIIELGDLHIHSLESILHSPRATAMRVGFQNAKAVEELCQRCSYKDRFL